MESFIKRMIEEHSQLVVRIAALEKFLYSDKSDAVAKPDFGNMCIQLKAMRMYAEALEARLANQNVVFEDGQYFERVAQIGKTIAPVQGSDSDIDKEKTNE